MYCALLYLLRSIRLECLAIMTNFQITPIYFTEYMYNNTLNDNLLLILVKSTPLKLIYPIMKLFFYFSFKSSYQDSLSLVKLNPVTLMGDKFLICVLLIIDLEVRACVRAKWMYTYISNYSSLISNLWVLSPWIFQHRFS